MILIFGAISLVSGILKNHLILEAIPPDWRQITGVFSYTTMLVSLIVSCILLGLIAAICLFIRELHPLGIQGYEFAEAYNVLVQIFILGELGQLLLVILVLDLELTTFSIEMNFQEFLNQTCWAGYQRWLRYGSSGIGILGFIITFSPWRQSGERLTSILFFAIVIGFSLGISSLPWF